RGGARPRPDRDHDLNTHHTRRDRGARPAQRHARSHPRELRRQPAPPGPNTPRRAALQQDHKRTPPPITKPGLNDPPSPIRRSPTAPDVIHPGPANFLRLAFGRTEPEYREGDMLPPSWLALYFLPRIASDALRPDGSPRDTGVVPPLALPRRMFA